MPKKMLGDVIYSYIYVYIAFYFSCLPFLIRNHSDEQWRVDRTVTCHRPTTWYRPPPLLVGVGAEDGEMTARRLYISWPGHLSNYSTANLYTGRVNRLWGEGAQDEGAPRRGGGGNVIVYKCSLRYLEGNLFLLRPYQYLEGNLFLLRPYQ